MTEIDKDQNSEFNDSEFQQDTSQTVTRVDNFQKAKPGTGSLVIGGLLGAVSLLVLLHSTQYSGSGSMGGLGDLMLLMFLVPTSIVFLIAGLIIRSAASVGDNPTKKER